MSPTQVRLSDIMPHISASSIALAFLLAFVVRLVVGTIYTAFFGPLSKFPGPVLHALSPIPLINIIRQGRECVAIPALHEKYGNVVRTAPNKLSYVGDSQIWKDIHGFRKAGQDMPYKDYAFYAKAINGVSSIINADDATHSRVRKVVSNAFSDRALREQEPLLKTWANMLKLRLEQAAGSGQVADMMKLYNCATFDVMSDLAFAESLHMLENSEYSPWVAAMFATIKTQTFYRAIATYGDSVCSLLNWTMQQIPSMRRKGVQHWQYTKARVDRRIAKTEERADIWARILEKSEGPMGISKEEQYSNASIFMTAGTETTATALSGITYNLLRRPDVLQKLQTELRESFANFDEFSLTSLAQFTYLDAVIREGLRIYPPVAIAMPRIVPKGGTVIAGNFIPEGTRVGIHHYTTYISKLNWTDPTEFRPERWLGDDRYKNDKRDAHEPFSVGPRNCLGKNLAWNEIRLFLATVLFHFDLELCDESAAWPNQKLFTLWEKPPLKCKLKIVKT